jgi:hypothetical protein
MRALLFQRFGLNGTHCEVITRKPTGMARKSSSISSRIAAPANRLPEISAKQADCLSRASGRHVGETEGYVCICARSTSVRNKQFTTVNRLANGTPSLATTGCDRPTPEQADGPSVV